MGNPHWDLASRATVLPRALSFPAALLRAATPGTSITGDPGVQHRSWQTCTSLALRTHCFASNRCWPCASRWLQRNALPPNPRCSPLHERRSLPPAPCTSSKTTCRPHEHGPLGTGCRRDHPGRGSASRSGRRPRCPGYAQSGKSPGRIRLPDGAHDPIVAQMDRSHHRCARSTPRAASTFDYLLARSCVETGRGKDAAACSKLAHARCPMPTSRRPASSTSFRRSNATKSRRGHRPRWLPRTPRAGLGTWRRRLSSPQRSANGLSR